MLKNVLENKKNRLNSFVYKNHKNLHIEKELKFQKKYKLVYLSSLFWILKNYKKKSLFIKNKNKRLLFHSINCFDFFIEKESSKNNEFGVINSRLKLSYKNFYNLNIYRKISFFENLKNKKRKYK